MCGGNPYTENHILRVSGTLICVTGIVLADFLLFFWQGTDVTTGSQWGVFFVRPVRNWRTWWYPAQELVCEIAANREVADNYDWGASFLDTYTGVDLSELCGTFYRLMILALLTCFATLCFGVAVLIQVVLSRLHGDPEACSHPYYDHCKHAIALVVVCVLLIVVTCVTFVIAFRASSFGPNVETKLREGLFVVLLSSASLGLVIFAYMRDRALLATKFEFERLEWKPVGDGKEEYRKRMQYDMQRLEAAKYGGLQSPYQMARDGEMLFLRISS